MRTFFQATFYFWIVTQIIFILFLLFDLFRVVTQYKLRPEEMISQFVAFVYIVLTAINLYSIFFGSNYKGLRIAVGIMSLLISCILCMIPFMTSGRVNPLIMLLIL